MNKKRITFAGLLMICLLMLSGCRLFTSNTIDLHKGLNESIYKDVAEKETEDVTEIMESIETTESIESTETTESTEVQNKEVALIEDETQAEDSQTEEEETTASNKPENKPSENQQPSDNEQSSESQQPSDTQDSSGVQNNTQTPSAPEEPEIYVVDYETEQETLTPENYKYGVTKVGVIDRTYEVYSDGSRVCVAEYPSYSYDSSTYNASDAEIQAESDANCNSYMGYYNEVLTLVNQIRAEAGVEPLSLDTNLCRAASMRALEMDYADYFEHARADGRSWDTAMEFYGCSCSSWGENIAAGYSSPASVVEGWKNSSGHYANMISADFTKLGVGYSNAGIGEYGSYWVQLFSN